MSTIGALVAECAQLIAYFDLFKFARLRFAVFRDCVRRITPHQDFVGDGNDHGLRSAHHTAARNRNLLRRSVDRSDDATDTATTPLGAFLLLVFGDVSLAHYDHLGRRLGLLICAGSPACPHAITRAHVGKANVGGLRQ